MKIDKIDKVNHEAYAMNSRDGGSERRGWGKENNKISSKQWSRKWLWCETETDSSALTKALIDSFFWHVHENCCLFKALK